MVRSSEQKVFSSREVRAIYDNETIRVYQAYNDEIADAALLSQTFRGPRDAGLWSETRTTWIKPSKVWMAYRCGWTVLKNDRNQARVLAIDLARSRFEWILEQACLSSHDGVTMDDGDGQGRCRESCVVVQWDPEREIDAFNSNKKHVFTKKVPFTRSIQIGLRGVAKDVLLDHEAVVRITDVTNDFKSACKALVEDANKDKAVELLWPTDAKERLIEFSEQIKTKLGMTTSSPYKSTPVPVVASMMQNDDAECHYSL